MTNDEVLEKFGKLIETKLEAERKHMGELIDQKLAPIKKDVQTVMHVVTRISTAVEALAAGQQDIRANMATKADVQDIKADLVKQQRRIENVEENTKTPNPHKN